LEIAAKSAAVGRTAGVATTAGEHIAFLDADDFWLPGWLSRVARRIDERPDAGMWFGGVDEQLGSGKPPIIPDATAAFGRWQR
jgi:hypothetical protein